MASEAKQLGAPEGPTLAVRGAGAPISVLVLPGYGGSGPNHWQTIWESRHPSWQRVAQGNWDSPRLDDWVRVLEESVRGSRGRVVLVSHSLACSLIAHWARRGSSGLVAAALLVAPADVDRRGIAPELRSFGPMPLERLPFGTWVVASTDDPHCTLARARSFSAAWGARFLSAGASGHINVASGHGDWRQGEALLERIVHAASVVGRAACG